MVFVVYCTNWLWKPPFKSKLISSALKFWLIRVARSKSQRESCNHFGVFRVLGQNIGPKESNRPSVLSKSTQKLQLWSNLLLKSFRGLDRRWILFLVTVLHGTFSPSVRILFDLRHAPDSALFNTLRLLLSSSLYFPILLHSLNLGKQESVGNPENKSVFPFLKSSYSWLFAGMELGIWVFLGNIFQVIGLETTSASRAAFLVQLQTIFVPIISGWLGQVSSRSDRFASIICITGVAILSSSKSYSSSSHMSLLGDCLEIVAAAFFSIYVIRLGHYARLYSSISLASVKVSTQALLSMFWLLWDIVQRYGNHAWSSLFTMASCESFQNFFHSDEKWIFLSVILWTGVIISGLSTLLQTVGQERVASSDAAIIYATQPLWACLFSFLLLHETLQSTDWLGSLFILGGTLLSAKKPFG